MEQRPEPSEARIPRLDQRLLDQCYAGFLHPNFYEKALFVKPTWRPYIVAGAVAGALCAMLLSALLAGQLSLVTRCIG
jgi:hypothetical protein